MSYKIDLEAIKAMGAIKAVMEEVDALPQAKMQYISECLAEYREKCENKGFMMPGDARFVPGQGQ